MSKEKKCKLPFSKGVVAAARWEFYLVALALFTFVWFDKDISSLTILASLSAAGLSATRSFYLWMAKHEHLMDKKIEYKKLELDSEDLDYELENLENQNFDIETF